MSNPKIQLRHDTSSNWSSVNPILLVGEVGIETDTNKIKIGNGTDNYNTLPYYGGGGGIEYTAGDGILINEDTNTISVNTNDQTYRATINTPGYGEYISQGKLYNPANVVEVAPSGRACGCNINIPMNDFTQIEYVAVCEQLGVVSNDDIQMFCLGDYLPNDGIGRIWVDHWNESWRMVVIPKQGQAGGTKSINLALVTIPAQGDRFDCKFVITPTNIKCYTRVNPSSDEDNWHQSANLDITVNSTTMDLNSQHRNVYIGGTDFVQDNYSNIQAGVYNLTKSYLKVDDTTYNMIEGVNNIIATSSQLGLVKPDGTTITIDEEGVITSHATNTGGTTDYNDLTNKPQIGGMELTGNKSLSDLGIQPAGTYLTEIPAEYVTETELNSKGYLTAVPAEYVTETELNGKGYITSAALTGYAQSADIPTATSDLTNDSGFITNTVNNLTNYTPTSGLSAVATSGSYNDLTNKPTIITSYNDLTDKPSIPTAYTLPTASTTVLGGVKVDGTTITIEDGTISSVSNTDELCHLAMPDPSKNVTLSFSGTQQDYTVPSDGYFMANGQPTTSGGQLWITCTGNGLASQLTGNQGIWVGGYVPCRKNDVVRVNAAGFTISNIRFTPCVGSVIGEN